MGPLLAVPAAAQVFNPVTAELDNGIQVVVIENDRAPVVTHMVWYRVGAADEPAGKSGIAHYLEHLMFKGTENRAPGEFSEIVASLGGRENAFTSQDYTGYFQTIAPQHLEAMMELEADRMTGLVLSDEIIEPERRVILEERLSRTENNPRALLSEQVRAATYLNHPYRLPIIGWAHEIETLTRKISRCSIRPGTRRTTPSWSFRAMLMPRMSFVLRAPITDPSRGATCRRESGPVNHRNARHAK